MIFVTNGVPYERAIRYEQPSHEPIINRRDFARPALTCYPFAPRDNNYYKMVSQIWEVVRDL